MPPAPITIQRQTFEAFGLRIEYDEAERRIEISASINRCHRQQLREHERPAPGGL
jgi:hypothetical protein